MFTSKTQELLRDMRARLDTLTIALVIMDPKVSTSADAYDGLRRQVAAAASSRQAHLVQLAQFSKALRRGASLDDLSSMLKEWMQQAGLKAESGPEPDHYEILDGEPEGGRLEVLSPAYIDPQTRVLVALGQARWVAAPPAQSHEGTPSEHGTEPVATEDAGQPGVQNEEMQS